uniref:Uncharacterized protein n=1 Tax=Oryza meridionalis TaxID=40149 RepID=A0A0E0C910_9ORYZ
MVFLDGIGGKGGALQEGKKFALYIDREVQSIDTRKWELGSSQTKGVKGTTHRTEGDHDGYAPLTRAAIPVTWGHAMEVPERMLKISGVNEFGPLDEKAATRGASLEPKIVFAGSSAAASTDKPMKSHE